MVLNEVWWFKITGGPGGKGGLHFYLSSQLDRGRSVRLPDALREPSQFDISSWWDAVVCWGVSGGEQWGKCGGNIHTWWKTPCLGKRSAGSRRRKEGSAEKEGSGLDENGEINQKEETHKEWCLEREEGWVLEGGVNIHGEIKTGQEYDKERESEWECNVWPSS